MGVDWVWGVIERKCRVNQLAMSAASGFLLLLAATTSRIPKPPILLLLQDVTTTFLLNAPTRIHKPFHFYWTGQEKTHFRSLFTLQAILACHHNLMIWNWQRTCELEIPVSLMYIFFVKIRITNSDQIQKKNSGLARWRHLWVSWILERYMIRRWLHKCLKSTEPRQALQKNIKPSVRLLRTAWLKEGPLLRNDSAATASTARYTGAGLQPRRPLH